MQLPPLTIRDAPGAWDDQADPRASAVLALFIDTPDSGPSLVFTRRSAELRSHAGQVGFPGGRREAWDENPAATALREAYEEVALDSSRVTLLGALPDLRSLDGKTVITLVGFADIRQDELSANPVEVAEIFTVPWSELTPAKRQQLRFNIFGKWRETPYYEACGHHVWGLTAWMLERMRIGEA